MTGASTAPRTWPATSTPSPHPRSAAADPSPGCPSPSPLTAVAADPGSSAHPAGIDAHLSMAACMPACSCTGANAASAPEQAGSVADLGHQVRVVQHADAVPEPFGPPHHE